MSYTAHELARLLLTMPDETIFVHTESLQGSLHIREVKLCNCEAEIFIYMDNSKNKSDNDIAIENVILELKGKDDLNIFSKCFFNEIDKLIKNGKALSKSEARRIIMQRDNRVQ